MRALVTGGAGFVGRHLTHKLLMEGWEVTVVDPIIGGSGGKSPKEGWPLFNPENFDSFHFISIDCRTFFDSHNPDEFDYVFHLAAIVGGRSTIENNPLAVAEDLSIDAQMWKWVSRNPKPKVVNFSSSAAYPINLQSKHDEITLLEESMIDFEGNLGMPDLTYGWAKLTSEYLGLLAYQKYGVRCVSYRPFSGYGPDQDLAYPFPSICKRALDNPEAKEFEVWGSGKQSRDFIHIDDCISGVFMTMDSIDNGTALNLSTGIATSFIELAKRVNGSIGNFPVIRGREEMPTGVASRCGNTNKQNDFGFRNRLSLDDGIKQCLDFLRFSHYKN